MIKSGYFNSVKQPDGTYDRLYNARELNTFLKGLISQNGVFLNTENMFHVEASAGMQVIVNSGKAMVNSHWVYNDSKEPIEITQSHVTLDRWTAIILRCDENDRTINLITLDGEPAVEPIKPEIIRNEEDGIYDICLAYVFVGSGVSEIIQDVIEDTRGYNSVCGYIHGLIEQVDTETLFKQWQTALKNFYFTNTNGFRNWFKDLTDELNVDTYVDKESFSYITTTEDVINSYKNFDLTEIFEYNPTTDILEVFYNGFKIKNVDVLIEEDENGHKIYTRQIDYENQEIELVLIKSKIGFRIV